MTETIDDIQGMNRREFLMKLLVGAPVAAAAVYLGGGCGKSSDQPTPVPQSAQPTGAEILDSQARDYSSNYYSMISGREPIGSARLSELLRGEGQDPKALEEMLRKAEGFEETLRASRPKVNELKLPRVAQNIRFLNGSRYTPVIVFKKDELVKLIDDENLSTLAVRTDHVADEIYFGSGIMDGISTRFRMDSYKIFPFPEADRIIRDLGIFAKISYAEIINTAPEDLQEHLRDYLNFVLPTSLDRTAVINVTLPETDEGQEYRMKFSADFMGLPHELFSQKHQLEYLKRTTKEIPFSRMSEWIEGVYQEISDLRMDDKKSEEEKMEWLDQRFPVPDYAHFTPK